MASKRGGGGYGQGSQQKGGYGQGSQQKGGYGQGSQQKGGYGQGSQQKGGYGQGSQQKGGYGQGSQQKGGYGQGSQQKGGYGQGSQQKGGYGQGSQQKGGYGQGSQQKGGYGQGSQQKGGYGQGSQQKGGYGQGSQQKGGYGQGSQQKGGYGQGSQQKGGYGQGSQQGGEQQRGGYGQQGELPIVQVFIEAQCSTFQGESGRQTKVVANYFRMQYKNGMHQYRVDYYVLKEKEERKKISTERRLAHRERFWKFVAKHEQWFKGKHNLVYDDSHLLYTFQPLDFEKSDLKELVITEKTELGKNIKIQMVIKPTAPYHVDYYVLKENGEREKINTKRRLDHRDRERFLKFVGEHEEWFQGEHNLVYDDSHLLYTVQPLDLGEGDLKELVITEKTEQGKEMKILMTIKPADGFRVINLILTQFARCPIERLDRTIHCDISRMFIKSPMPVDLGGFQLLKGLYGFAKRGLPQSGLAFANYDVTHSAFYKVGVDILQFYAFAKRGSFLSEREIEGMRDYGMDQKQRNELRSLLNGLKVKKKHMNCGIVESEATFCNVIAQNARTYRFQDDNYGDKDGDGMISVFDYYRKRYGYEIKYPIMPLIQLMPKDKKLMVPIEILRVSDKLQRLTRKLPDKLQAKTNQVYSNKLIVKYIFKLTTTSPLERFLDINQMVRDKILVTQDPFLKAFNVEIDPKFEETDVGIDPRFVEIDARILQQPNCAFARGQLNLKAVENPQLEGQPVQVLFDLIIVNDCEEKYCVRFDQVVWNYFADSCRQRGINLHQTAPLDVTILRNFNANIVNNVIEAGVRKYDEIKAEIEQYNKQVKEPRDKKPTVMPICVVIMPDNRTDIYKAFKGIFELRFGVHSQMLTKKAYDKLAIDARPGPRQREPMFSAIARNIFLKINAKCGGVNCRIQPTPNDNWSKWSKFVNPQSPTLFIGIDVTHPAPGDTLSPSISALVGNIDVHATRFTATVRAQQHRTEWIQNMHLMFYERLKHFNLGMGFFNKNGAKLPSKIIVFRDGVSESQFKGLENFELPGMRMAIDKVYGEAKLDKPKLTVLVVQKRHNTRFFDQNDKDFKNKGNLQPGTVVDGFITSHEKEFYLCSHKGMLGTSKPAHYFVIYNENVPEFTADDLQVCANNLCYLFARAPMPVSIPAPVYYAHLACFRARHHWAAADDGLRVGQDGQPLARITREGEEFIKEPNKAVVVQANLKPTMYFC